MPLFLNPSHNLLPSHASSDYLYMSHSMCLAAHSNQASMVSQMYHHYSTSLHSLSSLPTSQAVPLHLYLLSHSNTPLPSASTMPGIQTMYCYPGPYTQGSVHMPSHKMSLYLPDTSRTCHSTNLSRLLLSLPPLTATTCKILSASSNSSPSHSLRSVTSASYHYHLLMPMQPSDSDIQSAHDCNLSSMTMLHPMPRPMHNTMITDNVHCHIPFLQLHSCPDILMA